MTQNQAMQLEYPFQPDEIEWRVLRTTKDRSKGQVAAFVDSRAIQKRLDTVLGRENWQNRFLTVSGKDNTSTTHICEISIYYADKKEWVTKSDGAGCTDIEPIKGGLSNAFKRAASMWGLGRYLYELKGVWAALDDGKYISQSEKPRLDQQYIRFVNQYLASRKSSQAAGNSAAVKPQDTPVPQPASPQNNSVQQNGNMPSGRFQKTKEPTVSQKDSGCRIIDLKVTRGAKSSQTLVTFETPQGEAVSGYISGTPALKTGQSIYEPKIITKTAPNIGQYNIIESYKLAA